MGELVAWIIGWDLVLEYAAGRGDGRGRLVGTPGRSVQAVRHQPPRHLTQAPTRWCTEGEVTRAVAGCAHDGLNLTGALLNLPAVFIVALMTTMLVIGIKESASVNNFIVILKVAIVLLIVAVGLSYVNPANWHPFIPPNTGEWGTYGFSGVLRGAGLVFFAYIGFDAVSTAAQEAKNPQRDLPIGILGSLVICTMLYVLVSAVLVGMVPYTELNVAAPVAYAVEKVGAPHWARVLIDVGAVLGLASVVLVMLLGQSRVFYSMSRDGLLGRWAGKVHPQVSGPPISLPFSPGSRWDSPPDCCRCSSWASW